MDLEDAGTRARFVLHDRDASFTAAFGAVFQAAGARVVRCAVQAPRMNSVIERWIGSCRRELLDRTLVWNQRHLMTVLREYEDFCNTHRPHRTLNRAAPLRPLPDAITDLDHFRVGRRDRARGVIHEYRLVAQVFGTHNARHLPAERNLLPRIVGVPCRAGTIPRPPRLPSRRIRPHRLIEQATAEEPRHSRNTPRSHEAMHSFRHPQVRHLADHFRCAGLILASEAGSFQDSQLPPSDYLPQLDGRPPGSSRPGETRNLPAAPR
jgi:hypothetical protein